MENDTVFILLAAGKSQRMGSPKALLSYKSEYWIMEQIDRICSSTINEIYIGLGYQYKEVLKAIPLFAEAQHEFVSYKNCRLRILINPKPEFGPFSTLQTVLKAVPRHKSVMVSPVDIPILNRSDLLKILQCQNQIVLPYYQDKNGHPIKLSADFWNGLLAKDPSSSRLDFEIKNAEHEHISQVAVTDPAILLNLNTAEQWSAFIDKPNSRI